MALPRVHAPVTPQTAGPNAGRDILIVGALALLALALRIARLDFQPLWWDEGYSVWFAHQPFAEMVRLTALDIHPPLYYALLGGWSTAFGLGPVALRMLSVAFGVLAVPLAFVVATWLAGRRAGLIAALLLAVNPFHIYYSQEIRMYGLVMLWSLLAIGCAVRALGVGQAARGGWEPENRDGGQGGRWRWWVGYCLAMTLALYTQYYAGFLAAGLALAGLVELARQRRGRMAAGWLAAQGVVVLLFLPWVVYAGPKLVSYVSQKVVADSDRPLGLITYLARHLSAYAAGHLEGPLAPWWPIGLAGLAVLVGGLWFLVRGSARVPASAQPIETAGASGRAALGSAIRFLSIALATVLLLGWLVNLTFPFFPDRGERLLLLGLPLFTLLIATVIAALWQPSPGRHSALPQFRNSAIPLFLLLPFLALAALSLAAFYLVPRYPEEDYRPLIGQVEQWSRPEDTVFAVYPWQVGYFWSYGSADGPQPELSPSGDWTPEVEAALDAALARGHVWFPEHLSLGGILESRIEAALGGEATLLANRWYSPSTRLTGWAAARQGSQESQDSIRMSGPFEFPGMTLAGAHLSPRSIEAANQAIQLELDWAEPAAERDVSLRLVGPDGRTWAQQDFSLPSVGTQDRLGLLVPSGTPPGAYSVQLSLLAEAGGQPLEVTGPGLSPGATSLDLGSVDIVAPPTALPTHTLPIETPLDATVGDALRLLGVSASAGPLQTGEDLAVSLFWQALPDLGQAAPGDLFIVIQLLDRDGQVVAGWEGPPVAWHPTRAWQTGELVRSQQSLRLPATMPDGSYRLVAGVFDPSDDRRLAATWPDGPWGLASQRDISVPLGTVDVAGRNHVMAPPEPQTVQQADLARIGRLAGFDLAQVAVAPGDSLALTLYWQATETTGDRLKVFVHLLDEQGAIIGQSDAEPSGGAAPTSSWLPGETIVDRHTVAVRRDAAAGPATLVVGLYDPLSGIRVPWLDASGQPDGETLTLSRQVDVQDQ